MKLNCNPKTNQEEGEMKDVIYVGTAIATDGGKPGLGRIVGIAATANGLDFVTNITSKVSEPKNIYINHPSLWKGLLTKGVGDKEGFSLFNNWLVGLKANVICVSDGFEFYGLWSSMMDSIGKCAFGDKAVMLSSLQVKDQGFDINTWRSSQKVLPLIDIARERENGVLMLGYKPTWKRVSKMKPKKIKVDITPTPTNLEFIQANIEAPLPPQTGMDRVLHEFRERAIQARRAPTYTTTGWTVFPTTTNTGVTPANPLPPRPIQ